MKKALLIIMIIFLSGLTALSLVSKFVYNRSITATVAAMYIKIIDRNAMFEDENVCLEVMAQKTQENLKDIPLPETELSLRSKRIASMQYLEFNREAMTDTLILYFPGGAFVNQPTKEHFRFIERLAKETAMPVTVPVYLKATNYNCDEAYEAAMKFYETCVTKSKAKHVIFIGDSSGGNFALSLAMQLTEKEDALEPEKIILLSPWVDLSMENPEIDSYAEGDVMLGIDGLKAIGKIWADERSIYDPMVSPLYGSFKNLGDILIFTGTREILYPDILLFADRLKTDSADYELIIEEGMNHVYPLFPITEAEKAFKKIKQEVLR